MNIKGYAYGLAIGLAAVAGVAYLTKRAAAGALDSVTGALSAAGGAIENTSSAAWGLATSPVLDPGMPGASVGNGIVSAPANALDSLSLGLISGDGGNTGNGGILAWMEKIVSGDAFAPADAGIDYGKGDNNWND